MRRQEDGCHQAVIEGVRLGARYLYRLDGQREFPDPASRFQPDGVHGASEVVAPGFAWKDEDWLGMRLRDYVLYELHVGAFTPEGTFDAVVRRLPELKELGVTALELMPVAQFPGNRNWGYDGVFPYAVQNSYGGPAGLKKLVNAAHRAGLAVVLDVVYNHVGPEGNHLGEFGPYFMSSTRTPWGRALNFTGQLNHGVRCFFIENALYWQTEFHIDALRLDAVHAIRDSLVAPFLGQLADACHRQAKALGRRFHLIAERGMDIIRHLPTAMRPRRGLDAEWRDDFHHCVHVLLTREQTGYYGRFGGVAQFARVWRSGLAGMNTRSSGRTRRKGALKPPPSAKSFVVFSQNHDQTGNRPRGERLAALASFEAQKLAAATVLLSPFVPLLFMGEEYGETAPFQYFVSHSAPTVIQAVCVGRRRGLAALGWQSRGSDPQHHSTFKRSKLNWLLATQSRHRVLREFYRELIRLRKTVPVLGAPKAGAVKVQARESAQALVVGYANQNARLWVAFNYSNRVAGLIAPRSPRGWVKLLDSASRRWNGPGSLVPEALVCEGRVMVRLRAKSMLALRARS